MPSIGASVASKPTPKIDGESGGIVFDGKEGTVYGDVTLQEGLEIGNDETLTIPEGSFLNSNGKLTNDGTIVNKGTLTGEVGGKGTVTPQITTTSLPEGTVGTAYSQTLNATGNGITWSSDDLPGWLTLDSNTGTLTGTPVTTADYTFTVTATNSAGSDSKEFTLHVKPVSVTDVSLNESGLTLDVGETATLTAIITPDNATDQNVTWSSDPSGIVTIAPDATDSKKAAITAVGGGTATITATADGKSATCEVTVKAAATTITTQPSNVTVTEGETATFTVAATGSGTLTYQWQYRTGEGQNWTDISDATSPTYTINNATADMNGYQYRCKVKGVGGEATSNAATLTVQKSATPIDPEYVRYIVEHYKQNADGGYALADTERPVGEIGATVTAAPKTYEGYTYNPDAAGTVASGKLTEIKSDADIVTLKLYYDITLYTVTVDGSHAQTTGAGGYAEGAVVAIDAGTRSGYTFDGWTSADGVAFADADSARTTFTMPGKAVTVTANWKKKSSGGWTQQSTLPQTGVNVNMVGLGLSLILVSLASFAVLIVSRRRKNKDEEVLPHLT